MPNNAAAATKVDLFFANHPEIAETNAMSEQESIITIQRAQIAALQQKIRIFIPIIRAYCAASAPAISHATDAENLLKSQGAKS